MSHAAVDPELTNADRLTTVQTGIDDILHGMMDTLSYVTRIPNFRPTNPAYPVTYASASDAPYTEQAQEKIGHLLEKARALRSLIDTVPDSSELVSPDNDATLQNAQRDLESAEHAVLGGLEHSDAFAAELFDAMHHVIQLK